MLDDLNKLTNQELRAEVERLRRRDTLFNAAQELAHFGFCEWDFENGKIISCTPAYAHIFDMSVEDVIESQSSWEKVLQQIHPADRNKYRESYRSQLIEGMHQVEYRVVLENGQIRHLKEVGIVIRNDDSRPTEAVGLIQDLTPQINLQKEIEGSAAKLRLAARAAKLGYWHYDETAKRIIDVSDEYAEIYGYTVDEFLERFRELKDDMALVHPDDVQALYQAYDAPDDGRLDCVYRMLHRDGHWIHVREISIDIQDEDGSYTQSIGTLQDITELKEAELKAEKANRAKSEFLSRMSHELRTPLNAIIGFSQLMTSDQNLNPPNQSKAGAIHDAGQHLLNLVNEILDLSRLESGEIEIAREPVLLEAVVEESISMIRDMADNRGLTIESDLQDIQSLQVYSDKTRLRQVFLNLFSNAVKYNRENGRIEVVSSVDIDGQVSISIADTGPGIALEKIGGLFEPFNRLGAEFTDTEGTGIGLMITRQLVELMQGELEVESKVGEGSKFIVKLERAKPTDAQPDVSSESACVEVTPSRNSASTNDRILVAEDNIVNREVIEAQLDLLGYEADFVSNGVEALASWKDGVYPLLLTDVQMPEMNGNELIDHIRASESNSRRASLIAVTASSIKSDILECFEAGADDVLSKPVMLNELKRILEKWMPTGNVVDESS